MGCVSRDAAKEAVELVAVRCREGFDHRFAVLKHQRLQLRHLDSELGRGLVSMVSQHSLGFSSLANTIRRASRPLRRASQRHRRRRCPFR